MLARKGRSGQGTPTSLQSATFGGRCHSAAIPAACTSEGCNTSPLALCTWLGAGALTLCQLCKLHAAPLSVSAHQYAPAPGHASLAPFQQTSGACATPSPAPRTTHNRRRGAPHAGPVRLWPVAGCELQCLRLECQHFTAERCPRRLPPAATAPLCSGPVHTPRCKRPSCTPLLGSPSAPRAGRTAQLSYGKSAAKGRSARQQRCHAGAYLGGARDRRYNKTFIPHYRVCLR